VQIRREKGALFRTISKRVYCLAIVGLLLTSVFVTTIYVKPAGGQESWWDSNWLYRKMVTINHTKVAADLTGFPVLIDIVDSDLSSKAQSSGNDIVFTDSSMNKLSHEIERYDNNTGHLVAWVKVPSLSSTSDTALYMYYGNAAASNQQNPTAVWDQNYMMVQHLEETESPSNSYWHKYEENPILTGTSQGFTSVFYDNSTSVYHLFTSYGSILHFTSSNGKNWTADPSNPVLSGNGEGVPMAWKENDTWYMLYRYGSPTVIGLANSTDAVHWTRYEGNPVLTGTTGQWDDPSYSLDPWGVIKIGSTYYLWYNSIGGGPLGRCTGLATSTDLKAWTKDANNPIFTNGRFCGFSFKYGSYYYFLVAHYTSGGDYSQMELYRDSNPTFYSGNREYLGIAINYGPAQWDSHDQDTPFVLTDTIYRDTYAASNNELWAYYAGEYGDAWRTGMCIEPSIQQAILKVSTKVFADFDSTINKNDGQALGILDPNATGKIDGADEFHGTGDHIDCGDNNTLKGMNSLTVEAWVKPNSTAGSGIVSKWSSWTAGSGGSYIMWLSGTGRVGWGVVTENSFANFDTPVLQAGQWYHLVGVYDGSQIRLYINGTQAGTPQLVTGKIASTNDPCYVGRYSTYYMNGTIDEVRISNTFRGASWVSTEYNNQYSPSTFYTIGTEEAEYPKIYVDPSLVEKGSGDIATNFKTNVTVQYVRDLWGFDFNLTWDNSLITLANVDFSNYLDSIWGNGSWYLATNQTGPGYYEVAAVSTSSSFNSTEPTPLATLTFHVEDPLTNSVRETQIHFQTHKLGDSHWTQIAHAAEDATYRITGKKPTLNLIPTTETCRKYGETFAILLNVSDASYVEDFKFEIHYNATLLDVASVTWNPAWGSGTVAIDDATGNVTGTTSGIPISGTQTLMVIQFNATYNGIWKAVGGNMNNQSGLIFIQWANLSYSNSPTLSYVRGGSNQVNIGPDAVYTFSPVQGDINNDGTVDIIDLRTIAAYYNAKQGDPNWTEAQTYDLKVDGVIDIFDLTIVARNYGFTYP
jgi:hypothetical protein